MLSITEKMQSSPDQSVPQAFDNADSATAARVVSRPRRWELAAIAAAIVIFSLLVVFFGVGRWLVVEDPLQKANAIVVLSGRMPVRALEAARIYKAGYAPEVWLTRSEEPEKTLKQMGISYVGEDFYNLRVLVHEGVPPDAIRVLVQPIVNTADETQVVGSELRRTNGRAVIIVTSKAHTRRVRTLWRKSGGGSGKAIVRAASGDPFDPAHWWRTSSDALDVVREVLGLLNAWAGMLLPARAN
jgi:uncharacterized SAM-binding protein YcdF (DUF218 family)